jgi:hypothetical protein
MRVISGPSCPSRWARKARNSAARLRRWHWPITRPVRVSKAAKRWRAPARRDLVLDLDRAPRRGGTGRDNPDPRLQGGLFVHREHHLVRRRRARQEQTERGNAGEEGGVARSPGVQPEVVPPRFEVVAAQDAPHRLARGAGDHPVRDHLAGQFDAVPDGEGATLVIGQGAHRRHRVDGDQRGGKPAGGRDGDDP